MEVNYPAFFKLILKKKSIFCTDKSIGDEIKTDECFVELKLS